MRNTEPKSSGPGGFAPGTISDQPGVTAIEMVERLERGEIKVVWVAATNPVASLPNSERVRAAFERAETVIVQDPYHPTETTQVADILLPAAQWSERAGTMTNSERRICLLEQVSEPPGEALPDWQIIVKMAEALGYGDSFRYDGLEDIFLEYRELSRGAGHGHHGALVSAVGAASRGRSVALSRRCSDGSARGQSSPV